MKCLHLVGMKRNWMGHSSSAEEIQSSLCSCNTGGESDRGWGAPGTWASQELGQADGSSQVDYKQVPQWVVALGKSSSNIAKTIK